MRWGALAVVAAAGLALTMGCGPAVPRVRSVVSLAKLDCAECGGELATRLAKQPGVSRTRFDRRRAEVVVVAEQGLDATALARQLSTGEDYEVVAGAGKGSYLPTRALPEGLDVAFVASDGADVPSLEAHRVAGKVTVMEFGAVWCGPCKQVDEHMVGVLGKRADVAYRKLDIGDWDTPLARHYLQNASALPYVVVFAKDGTRVDAFGSLDLARLDRAIEKGGSR